MKDVTRLMNPAHYSFDLSTGKPHSVSAQAAADAHALAPRESVYATEVGNIAFESLDWEAARKAYAESAALGSFDPGVYRNLALTDLQLGRWAEALAAAQRAVYLDRFDPINQAVLAQIVAKTP